MLSPAVTRRLMRRAVAGEDARQRALRQFEGLSPREREVVTAIADGQTNAEIAAALLMSVPTVKAHVTHILTKAGLANRTQIALLAHDAGLALARVSRDRSAYCLLGLESLLFPARRSWRILVRVTQAY